VAVLSDAPPEPEAKPQGKKPQVKSENTMMGSEAFISASINKGRRNAEGQFDGVSDLFWRDAFYLLLGDAQSATKRQSFLRAKKNLIESGEIIESEGYYYPSEESGYSIIILKGCQDNG
jgi:hypothetical protein